MRHVPERRPHGASLRGVLGTNKNGHSRFPRLQLAHPRHTSKRPIASERLSGFNSHSLRRAATMSSRKPSHPGLAVDDTVADQLDAVKRNAVGHGSRAVAAIAVCPVTGLYPPLHLGGYFFKRAFSLHDPRTPKTSGSEHLNKLPRILLRHCSSGSFTKLATAKFRSMPRSAAQSLQR